jgi:hypothetical protein
LPSPQTSPGKGPVSAFPLEWHDQKIAVKIWLLWAQHTSSILHTITLQTIVYMPQSCANAKVAWTDIPKEVRETLFRVWNDGRELLWAGKCWAYLDKRGLTAYSNEVGKARVLVRLMSLAEIYREFCDRAWEEQYDCELVAWASELDLNRFRLAQCVGPTFEEYTVDDHDELCGAALASLAEEARREIYDVLIQGFGSESCLFVSLWNTVEFQREDDAYVKEGEDEPDQSERLTTKRTIGTDEACPKETEINWLEGAEAILRDVTTDKMSAYEWINQGMPRVR